MPELQTIRHKVPIETKKKFEQLTEKLNLKPSDTLRFIINYCYDSQGEMSTIKQQLGRMEELLIMLTTEGL